MFGAVALDDGAEGVFEEFEADVGEVTRDVGKCEVFGADELDGGAFGHCVVLFADEAGVFDGFVDDVVDVLGGRDELIGSRDYCCCCKREETHRFCADDADVVFMGLLSVEGHVYRPTPICKQP